MFVRVGLPALSALGVVVALGAVWYGALKTPVQPILFPPSVSPFEHTVAGSGIVEAASDNILIGTPFNEIIWDVFVKVGDSAKKGTPLFQLDIRTFQADLIQARAEKEKAVVEYENASVELALFDSLTDRRAISTNNYNQIFYKKQTALAAIDVAQSKIDVAQTFIDRSIIKAPCDGKVLQVNIHKGEIANLNPFTNENLMLFGPTCPFHIRVSIDEDDAWRFQPNTKAVAFVRGNSSLCYPLKYVRTEPLMIPKQSLTGQNSERVDTRVLVVIYSFDCDTPYVYLGQIMDVYIKALPANLRFDDEAY
jgi:biotin carboxyl carrier protein